MSDTRPQRDAQNHRNIAEKLLSDPGTLDHFVRGLEQVTSGLPSRLNADPRNVERGLAQLVLTLVELLRQLMERQAVRRMEQGTLTEDEIERLGQTFLLLRDRMQELKATFGLKDAELNVDLGPLGKFL